MNIPDKAVEAARKALLVEAKRELGARGDVSAEGARFMKLILEAAAPFIAAQALRDAADEFRWFNSEPITTIHPDRSQAGIDACREALERRADQMDPS